MVVRLPRGEWNIYYDHQLGQEGGFGIVFAGSRDGFPPLAIKKLKLTANETANRELRIAEKLSSATLKYIVPVFDYGQDSETDNYFIVMAKAEKNLREELVKQGVNIPFLGSPALYVKITMGDQGLFDAASRNWRGHTSDA
jgi:serine/threonine protein kinase